MYIASTTCRPYVKGCFALFQYSVSTECTCILWGPQIPKGHVPIYKNVYYSS
jgi:hypothetical protein